MIKFYLNVMPRPKEYHRIEIGETLDLDTLRDALDLIDEKFKGAKVSLINMQPIESYEIDGLKITKLLYMTQGTKVSIDVPFDYEAEQIVADYQASIAVVDSVTSINAEALERRIEHTYPDGSRLTVIGNYATLRTAIKYDDDFRNALREPKLLGFTRNSQTKCWVNKDVSKSLMPFQEWFDYIGELIESAKLSKNAINKGPLAERGVHRLTKTAFDFLQKTNNLPSKYIIVDENDKEI